MVSAMDFVGPYSLSHSHNLYLISFIDQFTKFAELIPVPYQMVATFAKVFVMRIIAGYGISKFVVSDRGSQFLSELFTKTCKLLNLAEYALLATILGAVW